MGNRRFYSIGAAMLLSVGLALAITPRAVPPSTNAAVDLESFVPMSIQHWRVDPSVMPIEPTPDMKKTLEEIYEQTLSRTYVNARGERVMLSIAYGGNQSDAMQVHRPEVCYAAQGFAVTEPQAGNLSTRHGPLSVRRLIATQDSRIEPITYWIMIGDQRALSGTQRKLAQLRYGLTGRVPDGMIVRVSSIGRDQDAAFKLQSEFVDAMVDTMDSTARLRIAGVGQPAAPN